MTCCKQGVSPVAEERAEDHERVLHERDDLPGRVTTQQQLSAVLELSECEVIGVPVQDHLLKLRFNVLLLHRGDTDVLTTTTHTCDVVTTTYTSLGTTASYTHVQVTTTTHPDNMTYT